MCVTVYSAAARGAYQSCVAHGDQRNHHLQHGIGRFIQGFYDSVLGDYFLLSVEVIKMFFQPWMIFNALTSGEFCLV